MRREYNLETHSLCLDYEKAFKDVRPLLLSISQARKNPNPLLTATTYIYIYIYIYTHTHTHTYVYIYTHTHTHTHTHRVSQEESARLQEGVPYVKIYRYNPKHLCPKLNGYGDNGRSSLKL